MKQKNCKLCLKPILNPHSSQVYHTECFKLYRKEYQNNYNKTAKAVRFNVDVLKKEVDELKEIIIKEVLERIKK